MQTRFWSKAFAEALQKRLIEGDYEAVHFQSLEMGVYLAGARPYTRAKLIYDAYNAEAELQRAVYLSDRRYLRRWPAAFYSWIQARRLGRFERALCQGADATLAVSSEDQALLQALAGDKKVYLVNNGVKVADYARPIDPLPLQQPALVFTGTMDYRPNVDAVLWFAESILPRLAEGHFYIVGGHPHPSVQALASSPNITVTGRVPEVIPYLQGGTVFVVPLRVGSGTRLKLLQALASGCAVVSTRVGSAGLPLQDGRELLLADTAEAFAAAIQRLYDDPLLRQHLGEQGRAFVAEHFDWRVLIPRLLAVYADLGL
jgi:glycosyltransferase involved in cell wall biosynthesis